MLKKAVIIPFSFVISLLIVVGLYVASPVLSAADHVVISEIQVGGVTATDEFIELYNPTSSPVDMEGWRLTRKTSTGTQSNLVSSISGVIPAHGYFLIAHPNYDGTTTPDLPYSATSNSITANNSVLLYNDAGATEVDMVHMDVAIIPEGTPTETPEPSTSTERKALGSSTVVSMAIGGSDELLGNGEDTDNSHDDFLARDIPQPQNSSSSTEDPGQTPSPTPTPVPTESPTPTPEPTETPSPTPVPTETPTPTPPAAGTVVVSEVQLAGTTSKDEFIELYNPTDSGIVMEDWRLTRKTATGNESTLVLKLSGSIESHKYFLIAHPDYDGGISYDQVYSATSSGIAANNTIVLYNSDETPQVIDKVGMGTASDFETAAFAENPAKDTSIERKANASSTLTSMGSGGVDEFAGNGEDTDNNNADFVTRDVSDPQNSSSPAESPGVSPSPTPTPEPTETPSPTPEPTETPMPTPPATGFVVISEIQLSGITSKDEFVELYNSTGATVDLTDWRLNRKTSSGTESTLVLKLSGSIESHGYFLIAHPDYDGSVLYDQVYSATSSGIASNNTVILYNNGDTPEVVDKVGMGTATDTETLATENPAKDTSVERKANASSTPTSMGPGGADEFAGNGEDTDNNSADFSLKTVSEPQNSSSLAESPGVGPSPTPGPTGSPTPTPEPTETPSPTPEPTETPTPTPPVTSAVVISEIQLSGITSKDEFVELYNPTEAAVDLSSHRLVKRTSTGSSDSGIVAFTEGDVIEARGFFLWCNNDVSEISNCDKSTSSSISDNNSIGLRNGPSDTGSLVDSATFGTVANPLGEGTFIDTAPEASQSAERKANANSTATSMGPGGADEFNGNGQDTDNNNADFIIRETSDPQNSSSPTESPGVEPSPTPSPEPTESPTPTPEPTETPMPTETPTPTPTIEPTPIPTPEPSPTPTGKVIGRFLFPGRTTICTLNYRFVEIGFFRAFFPYITCTRQ